MSELRSLGWALLAVVALLVARLLGHNPERRWPRPPSEPWKR